VGEDGHIASLFPQHELLSDETKGFLEILDSPKLPPHRITVSKNMILEIKVVFVFFIGDKKKKALEGFLDDRV
jgi:6-phosphogluconolactonase